MRFVLLSPRRGRSILDAEYDDFLRFSELMPYQLEQRALDTPDADFGDFTDVTGVFIGGSPFTITEPDTEGVHPLWQRAITDKLVDFLNVAAGIATDTPHRRTWVDPVVSTIPTFSVCYGASMMAQALGGEISQKYGETAGGSGVRKTNEGHRDELTAGLPDEFTVLTGHKDSIESLPAQATLLLSGDTCPNQLYRLGSQVWISQFHPEMDAAGIARRVSHYGDNGYYDPADKVAVFERFNSIDTATANSLLRRFVTIAAQRRNIEIQPGFAAVG